MEAPKELTPEQVKRFEEILKKAAANMPDRQVSGTFVEPCTSSVCKGEVRTWTRQFVHTVPDEPLSSIVRIERCTTCGVTFENIMG